MKKTDKQLTIVVSTIVYSAFTGVELYVYELSRELKAMGHRVIVIAPEPGGEIVERTINNGVEVYSFEQCPNTIEPDVLHVNEQLPSMFALSRWPKAAAIATIHSQFPVEAPYVSDRISSYVCIRQEIIEYISKNYPAISDRTTLIHNGFDFRRFKEAAQKPNRDGQKSILFVGTIDAIRRQSIEDLIEKTRQEGYTLRVVGKKYEKYLDNPPSHVEVLSPRWDVENLFTSDVVATAGVLLGRSTIEGWIAGRPGWIYDIETDGSIRSSELFSVPGDIEKFDSSKTAKELVALYLHAIEYTKKLDQGKVLVDDLYSTTSSLVMRSTVGGNITYTLMQRCDYLESIVANQHLEIERLQGESQRLRHDTEQLLHRTRILNAIRHPRTLASKIRTKITRKNG